jgi:transposase
MAPYSMDLRVRVMADVEGGMQTTAVARKYRVSTDWIRKLKRLRRETGSFGPRPQRVAHATKLDNDLARLDRLVEEKPDATLQLREELGAAVSVSSIWRALRRLQITFKKSPPGGRAAATRHSRAPCPLASRPTRSAGEPARVYRRDGAAYQSGSSLRSRSSWPTAGRSDTAWSLEDDHLCGRLVAGGSHRADGRRWTDERTIVSGLHPAGTRAHTPAGRHRGPRQPLQPQDRRRAASPRIRGSETHLSAAVQSRLQPHSSSTDFLPTNAYATFAIVATP